MEPMIDKKFLSIEEFGKDIFSFFRNGLSEFFLEDVEMVYPFPNSLVDYFCCSAIKLLLFFEKNSAVRGNTIAGARLGWRCIQYFAEPYG